MDDSPNARSTGFDPILNGIRAESPQLDSLDAWPERSLRTLADAGRLSDAVPTQYGGSGNSPRESLAWSVALSEACLVTAFVVSQRDAACHRIALSPNEDLKKDLFPRLLRGEILTTVGISHLSTSRQHWRKPSVTATSVADGYLLTGTIPWVTGASRADELVVGGTLDDGRQILGLTPRTADGVSVGPSLQLMGLSASQTAIVELHDVLIRHDRLLACPVPGVMKQGAAGTGSLTTSALALGAAGHSIRGLLEEGTRRPDLLPIADALCDERNDQLDAMLKAADSNPVPAEAVERCRERANSLVLRAAQAWLAACKGEGYLSGHPAERAVREAMFFLVWSCPQPVVSAALREFACLTNA